MPEILVAGRILRWGNSYGIRLTKAELERAGLRPDQDIVARLKPAPAEVDLDRIPFFEDDPDVGARHDEHLGRARSAARRRPRRAPRRRH